MRLRTIVVFGVGYVLGTRAGRERYGQIQTWAKAAAARLEDQRRGRATTPQSS